MGSFRLSSDNLFVRSVCKSRVMVVRLAKDVHSSVVERKDWEIVETVGVDTSCDSLDVFGRRIQGQELKRLALNLCETRLWVNRKGICFARLGITTLSFHFIFCHTNEKFDWAQYGQLAKDDHDAEINRLQGELDKSLEYFRRRDKEFEVEKEKVTRLKDDITKKDEEIVTLEEMLNKSIELYQLEKENAQETKDNLDSKITNLKEEMKYKHLLRKCRRAIMSHSVVVAYPSYMRRQWRFNQIYYEGKYPPDLSSMPIYKTVDEDVEGQIPHDIYVCVNDLSFQSDNWWFIKIKDVNSSYESLFAYYGGTYGSIVIEGENVKLPYNSTSTFTANNRFLVVVLRGYGAVFGFSYSH